MTFGFEKMGKSQNLRFLAYFILLNLLQL